MAVGALALWAPGALAGLDLTWRACGSSGGDTSLTLDCANLDSVAVLYGSFQLPDTLTGFAAMTITLDVETETGELPPFWHFEAGDCNVTGLGFSDAEPSEACEGALNPWGEDGSESVSGIGYGPQFGAKNRGRFIGIIARPEDRPITLIGGENYFAFKLRLFSDNAKEARGPCAGCRAPATIVWTSALLQAVTGSATLITSPGPRGQCVRLNGARPGGCKALLMKIAAPDTSKTKRP